MISSFKIFIKNAGKITESTALREGFTHKGSYYGVPIYMTLGDVPLISVRWGWTDPLFDLVSWLESVLAHTLPFGSVTIPAFKVKSPIDKRKQKQ